MTRIRVVRRRHLTLNDRLQSDRLTQVVACTLVVVLHVQMGVLLARF